MRKIIFLLFILFFQNVFLAQNTFQEHIITNSTSVGRIYTFDLDNDGDLDILASNSNNKVIWYQNLDGLGTFSNELIIANEVTQPRSVHAGDIDGDGDLDVVFTTQDGVSWIENLNGLGDFGVVQQTNIVITITQGLSSYIFCSDMNNDGDVDIIAGNITKMSWFDNLDGEGNFEEFGNNVYECFLPLSYCHGNIIFNDLDSDNDIDMLFSNYYSDHYNWVENSGNGSFLGEAYVGGVSFPHAMYVNDLDNDGYKDVILGSGEQSNNYLRWYKNVDGLGNFILGEWITISSGSHNVCADDIDGDGDNDILSTSPNENRINWYENTDAMGSFGEEQTIGLLDTPIQILTTDIDNDDDKDIIVTNAYSIVWYENIDTYTNSISGTVRYNLDDNFCDIDDIPVSDLLVTSSNSSIFSVSTHSNGAYFLEANDEVFITEISSNLPDYYSVSPNNSTNDFNGLEYTNAVVDFCITGNQIINDLEISIYPSINEPRPGFDTSYQISYKNFGTTQLNGEITFEYDSTKLQFLNASESVLSQTSNSITFGYSLINPLEVRTIDLMFNVFPPPITNIDDNLISTVTINPLSGDNTPTNNIFALEQTVIGSYDPNDINVLEGEEILIEEVDNYLHYIIRFQNTGTASAINVKVDNILDDNLDWSTFSIEGYSHNASLEIRQEKILSFIFDDINLPDSTNDEENSHGFITYKIKPRENLIVGDIIQNRASIFFDFNPAIYTNTVSTKLISDILSIDDVEEAKIKLYPNPVISKLNIEGLKGYSKISVFDLNGRKLKTYKTLNSHFSLNVSDLNSGIYFLEINFEFSTQTLKFIKS
jgi:uncharacterized repeat protein (TIGR01451 family)